MLLRILPVVILTVLLPDLYLYRTYLRKLRCRRLTLFLLALPDVVLLLSAVVLGCTETLSPANMDVLGLFFLFYMIFALPKAAFLLVSLPGRLLSPLLPGALSVATAVGVGAAVLLLGVMVYGSFRGPVRLRVTRSDFSSPRLAGFFRRVPYRAAFRPSSDFHAEPSRDGRPDCVCGGGGTT